MSFASVFFLLWTSKGLRINSSSPFRFKIGPHRPEQLRNEALNNKTVLLVVHLEHTLEHIRLIDLQVALLRVNGPIVCRVPVLLGLLKIDLDK